MNVKDWEALLECPECDNAIVIHDDKLHPSGRLHCTECGENLQ